VERLAGLIEMDAAGGGVQDHERVVARQRMVPDLETSFNPTYDFYSQVHQSPSCNHWPDCQ
jgi:hypothetical protein